VAERTRPAAAAIAFLTALPVGRRRPILERDLRSGAVLFPLVGGLIGALAAFVAWAAALVLPELPAAALGIAAGIAVTGAMHLDGLADTADGVGAALGGHDPAAAMADPRLGTFGGAALFVDLLLKTSAMAGLLIGGRFPIEIVAAAALGRGSALALAAALPYRGGGTGSWLGGIDRGRCVAALAMGVVVGALTLGWTFVAMLASSVVVTLLLARWSSRRLGGATGDVFGAASEASETLALVAALAIR
jgi:adenosylcobinamide-GDP ribazoletransferase